MNFLDNFLFLTPPGHGRIFLNFFYFIFLMKIYYAGAAIIMLLVNYGNFANVVTENIIKTGCIWIK